MTAGPVDLASIDVHLVRTWEDAQNFMSWLGNRREYLAIDTETTGLNVGRDKIRLAQFGDHTAGYALAYGDWRGLIKQAIEGYQAPTVCHNLLYDSKMLKADGITIPQRWANDSMVMTWLMDPAAKMALKTAAARYVDPRAAAGQRILAELFATTGWNWATVPVDHPAYWAYGVLDTCLTSCLASALTPKIDESYRRAYELEVACIHVLREAEIAGMMTDADYRRRAAHKLTLEIEALKPEIPLKNPGSDAQVRDYLLRLGVPLVVQTEHGALSVDKDVLKWVHTLWPQVGADKISEYRQKTRLLSNYFEKMDDLAVDGVVRASTKPVAARTGRMSVTDPPLQTLPRGRVVRDAFIAREGQCLVMADFSGMEMRALASMANEENMLAAYARGEDLHNFTATALFGPGFTKPQRTICKNAGFGKVYGAGIEKFAVTAGISIDEAKAFMTRYDELFPGVKGYMHQVVNDVMVTAGGRRRGRGWVELIDGRRIPVDADKAYTGVNYTIQGSCAIVTKEKIVELAHAGLEPFFRLPVHDELIFECPIEDRHEVRQIIEDVMPDRRNFPGVVLEIESDCVSRWGIHYEDDFEPYLPTEKQEWELQTAA